MRRRGLAAALVLAVAGTGCPSSPKTLVYDLAARMRVAERWSSREVVLFGTPTAERHQADGFYREAGGADYAWAGPAAQLSFTWTEVRPRAAVIEMAPSPGNGSQWVEVRLNSRAVASFGLNERRHRYPVPLPAEHQRVGENRVTLDFAKARPPADGDTRQLAAYVHAVAISARDDGALDDLLARNAPFVFASESSGGVPALVQVGPSAVRYALRLPAGAELRFRPELHPMARASIGEASFRVTIEGRNGGEREIWARTLTAREPKVDEVVVRLPGAGDVVRLGLHVGGAPGARYAWGVWNAPRVLGRDGSGASPLLNASPLTDQDDRKGDPLRKALAGANVILVVLDAARAEQFGCYGYPRKTSPEIDRIAAEGVVFERAYTPAVYTLGAMSSVWTSQHPDRHHSGVSFADSLPANRLTLTEVLSAHGVYSAGFVANAMAGKAKGFHRGFGEFHEIFNHPDLGSRSEVFRNSLHPWLRRHDGTRFFAYAHFREPHFPYEPPPPFNSLFGPDTPLTRAQRMERTWYTDVNQKRVQASKAEIEHLVRLYDGNLAHADQEVGVLRQALESAGLWERTVLIVTADHGEQLFEHAFISHGGQVYEQSARVPLIVRFPKGMGPSGARIGALVDLLDLAPTIADVFGLRGKGGSDREFQGRSLLPLVVGGAGRRAVLIRTIWDRPVYALRDDRYKFVYDTKTGAEEMFDLTTDPAEAHDLAPTESLLAAYYRHALHDWIATLARPTRGSAEMPGVMTREQCENLKAMGYIGANHPCPEK